MSGAKADNSSIIQQMEQKMKNELENNQPYEALQYVQSFIARKKKTIAREVTSSLVYHASYLLVVHNSSSSAGVLLKWFMEDGAGVEYSFKPENSDINSKNYCDVQRLSDLLSRLSIEQAAPIVEITYGPLHLAMQKLKLNKGPLVKRMKTLETLCAKIFRESGKWFSAFKCYVRLDEMDNVAKVLNQWAQDGYTSEKPLFFARALFTLLFDGQVSKATTLLKHANPIIEDNIAPSQATGGPNSAALAIWHLSVILTDLAELPPNPRVDKPKLFRLLVNQYGPLIEKVDSKLLPVLMKIGEKVFGFYPAPPGGAAQPNPMAMLQGLMGGKGGPAMGPGMGGPDLSSMMSMMSKMQQQGRLK